MAYIQLGDGRLMDPATFEIIEAPAAPAPQAYYPPSVYAPAPVSGSGWSLGQTTTTDGNVYAPPPVAPAPVALPPMPSPGSYTPGAPIGQEVQAYLNALQTNSNNSGSGAILPVGYTDPATGQSYTTGVTSYTDTAGNANTSIPTPTSYQTTDANDWYSGKTQYITDLAGNVSDFKIDDPTKTDWGQMAALAIIAAATGGAASAALGGAGAGAAASVPGGMGGVAEAGFGAGMGAGAAGGAGAGAAAAGGAAGGLSAAEAAGAGLGFGDAIGAGIATVNPVSAASMASAMGMTPEAFAAMGAGGNLGAAGAAGGYGGGASSGLGSGVSDFGLGNVADAGITGSPFTPPSVQAPLPMNGSYLQSLGQYTPGSSGMMTLPSVSSLPSVPSISQASAPAAPAPAAAPAAAAPAAPAAGAGGAAGGGGAGGGGVPPPPNPYNWQTYLDPSNLLNMATSGSTPLGLATTALGALSGSQGSGSGAGSGSGGSGSSGGGGAGGTLDSRLEPFVYGSNGLIPQTQGLLNSQGPQAQQQSAQLASVGSGLLGRSVAGNTPITLDSPTTSTNPYLAGMADDIGRRTNDLLGQSFNSIRGNSVMTGGMGGSRQGVAEGSAIGKAADSLQGQLAGLYGSAYNSDQGRALTKYGLDQGYALGNRQQDLAGVHTGAGLLGQSQTQAWNPLTQASNIYKPFSNLSSAQGSGGSGGGTNWNGIAGGLLSGAALAGKLGWWG